MRFNTYEVVGIAASILLMAVALWLVRIETTNTIVRDMANSNQAAVFVADDANQAAAVADAIDEAARGGTLERLVIDDVIIGAGDRVEVGDTISVHYIGRLQNGQEFDNSYTRGTPFQFTVGAGRVIAGWEEGVQGMQVGGQRILVIPAEQAYGERAMGPIPANSTLVFTIELLSIE